jgi:putative endopeptidase
MSKALKSGIDPTSFSSVIHPQQDLFRYVNGPWIDTYALPEDRSRFGSFDKLADDAEEQIREILEDSTAPAAKSSALYTSFLDTKAIEAAGLEGIRSDLASIDDTADKHELITALGALNPQGGPDLLGIGVYGDPGDPERNIVHIEQGGLALPDEAYYREDRYAAIREAYQSMVAKLLLLAKYATDMSDASAQSSRFVDLERRIAACHWDVVETRDQDKTYNPTTYDALQSTLSHLDISAWAEAWQRSYAKTATASVMPLDFVATLARTIVHEPSFLSGLDAVWDEASLEDLQLWARVHTLISWAGYLSQDFEQARFDFYGKVLSGTTEMRARWKRGVALVNGICGEDVGREYVKRHFPESSKHRMEQLVSNLIDAYRVSIQSSDWLGEATKAKALDKLAQFSPKIGYTNHWRDYAALDVTAEASLSDNIHAAQCYETAYQMSKVGQSVDKDEWLMNPQTVNAYYEPTMNVIVFPAAILQPPFFDPDADDAANYGGIGAVIGHEIGHGFDDQGSKYDGSGRLNDWWTAEDRKNFEERTTALIDQYNAFVPAQLAEQYADDPAKAPHVNGALTIGENIGDLGGVNISLKAYAFALDIAAGRSKDGSVEGIRQALMQAPEIEGFTGVQRFFIAYAAIWRTKLRDQLAEQYLQIDPHSPAEFRTNGIVRNVDLFHQAFSVNEGDDMWLEPSSRVRIW